MKWVLVFLLSLTAGCTRSQAPAGSPSAAGSVEDLRIIDAHVHTRFDGKLERTSGIPVSLKRLKEELEKNGVVGAVSHTGTRGEGYQTSTKALGIIHCAGVGPKIDAKQLERGLKSGKFSCIKVYLGYVHQWANHPRYRVAYRLARKYRVPVVFHTGDTYSTKAKLKYSDPLTIDEVAVDFPDVQFVIAHLGNPWIQSAAEVAYKNPNVSVDLSALLIGDLSKTPAEDVDAYVTKPIAWAFGYIEDPSKLMFGTDWPLTDIGSYVAAVKRAIPKEHWRAVFHDNAARIFGFDKRALGRVEPRGSRAKTAPRRGGA